MKSKISTLPRESLMIMEWLEKMEITQKEAAERIGISAQLFNKRLLAGKFTLDQIEQIAMATGGHLHAEIVERGGKRQAIYRKKQKKEAKP